MRSNSRKHLQSGTQGQLLRPHEESLVVLQALVQMSIRIGKPFSEERMEQLEKDLVSYPVAAIEWACDSWARNSKVLPALSDLLQMLRTWHADNNLAQTCPQECQERHGKGYGTNDLLWLWKARQASGKAWDGAMWDLAMDTLDAARQGGAPSWRR